MYVTNFRNWQNPCLKGSPIYGSWEKQMWQWSMRSCSTKTWNVIRFNLIKGAGFVVDALFRAAPSLECNLIQINKTDWVYPRRESLRPAAILKMQQLVSST